MPTSSGQPDEVVAKVADIEEVPSELVAEAKLRHEQADSDLATPQEKKQAAVEQAHALSTRPDGSYAQLHETEEPTLAVADDSAVKRLQKQQEEAAESLKGSEPANSPAGVRREDDAARARADASAAEAKSGQAKGSK